MQERLQKPPDCHLSWEKIPSAPSENAVQTIESQFIIRQLSEQVYVLAAKICQQLLSSLLAHYQEALELQ